MENRDGDGDVIDSMTISPTTVPQCPTARVLDVAAGIEVVTKAVDALGKDCVDDSVAVGRAIRSLERAVHRYRRLLNRTLHVDAKWPEAHRGTAGNGKAVPLATPGALARPGGTDTGAIVREDKVESLNC